MSNLAIAAIAIFTFIVGIQGTPVVHTAQDGSSMFLLVVKSLNWDQAVSYCQTMNPNSHLATVDSSDKADLVLKLFQTAFEDKSGSFYIGANDRAKEGDWRWQGSTSEERPLVFQNWATGEPNSHDGTLNEDCVDAEGQTGKWRDRVCDYRQKAFVCEFAIPE